MGWNIELLCVRDRNLDADHVVPDVFGASDTWFGFEDATSVSRDPDLCVARIGDWLFVVDVGCRMSEAESHLEEVSTGREAHVFRIADEPLHVTYRDGAKQIERRGLRDCAAELVAGEDRDDGELVAWALLHQQTECSHNDLWDAKYQSFALF